MHSQNQCAVAPEQDAEARFGLDGVERRRQPRDPNARVDWESIVVGRMASRVKSLAEERARGERPAAADDWEEVVLRALRRRVEDLEAPQARRPTTA